VYFKHQRHQAPLTTRSKWTADRGSNSNRHRGDSTTCYCIEHNGAPSRKRKPGRETSVLCDICPPLKKERCESEILKWKAEWKKGAAHTRVKAAPSADLNQPGLQCGQDSEQIADLDPDAASVVDRCIGFAIPKVQLHMGFDTPVAGNNCLPLSEP
jgi:hypothetical protein